MNTPLQKLLIIALLLININAFAENDLKAIIAKIDTASTTESLLKISAETEKLTTNKASWLVYYWTAFNYTAAAYKAPRNQKDKLLDKAQILISKANKLTTNEVELLLLQSWVYSVRIAVAPASRAKEYNEKASATREKAHQLAPFNPRYYFLKGSTFYYTPKKFGGGKQKAKPVLEEAKKRFTTFHPKSDLHPSWGLKQTKVLLEKCD